MSPKVSWLALLFTLVPAYSQSPGTVSVRQLQTKVAPRVERLVSASSEAVAQGNLERGVEYLEKAARAEPASAAIHHDLGVLYLRIGDAGKARIAFSKSLETDPGWPAALTGISLSLYSLGDAPGAELAARRAVEIDPRRRQSQFALGMALASQGKYKDETLQHLRSASGEFPEARVFAASVLLHQGAIDEARNEVLLYLQSGQVELREIAQEWLRLLTLE